MNKFISRRAAINELYNIPVYFTSADGSIKYVNVLDVVTRLVILPAIDAIEVVRCKECKWWHKAMSDDGEMEYINYSFCEKKHQGDGHEWYCPDGERRESDE